MKILAQVKNGKMALSDYNRRSLNDFIKQKENQGVVVAIESRTPESRQVRKFYHGAILPLWAYLNGYEYRDSEVLGFLHEHAKREFNGELVVLDRKEVRRGGSTKGLLNENDQHNSGYLERVINYLEENYGIDRDKVLNHEHYKKWRDEFYSIGEHEDYIAYLIDLKFLKG